MSSLPFYSLPLIACLICWLLGGRTAVGQNDIDLKELATLSVSELETQVADIDEELQSLARFSLRNEVGAIGHRSVAHQKADVVEWVEVEFEEVQTIDRIFLVPCLRRYMEEGFRADGFPAEYRILAGTLRGSAGVELARFTEGEATQRRIAPVIIDCPGVDALWIRIEASKLTRRGFDGKYALQLSEVLVFNGQENIALHQRVRCSSQGWKAGGAREDRFLVDGDLPYLMHSGRGEQSLPFIGVSTVDKPTGLTIDLLESQPVDRLRLHSVDVTATAPRSTPSDFGIPPRFIVEGADDPSFVEKITLLEAQHRTPFEVSPIMTFEFPACRCRYLRLTPIEPYVVTREGKDTTRFGFAEVEILSNGRNVAFEKPATAEHALIDPLRPLTALTDGRNVYGDILPLRTWLEELAKRHELETSRPVILAELNSRYAQQEQLLGWMQGLAALLVMVIGLTIYVSRRARQQKIADLRKRFAADLHDELGANLHTIGLLSDLALQPQNSVEDLQGLHARIRAVTNRSAAMIRSWGDIEQSEEFCSDLVADMERAAERIVVNLEHEFSVEGAENLDILNSRTRGDLLLFYKECLVNIGRHAEATRLRTLLKAGPTELRLEVVDDGRGLSSTRQEAVPASLRRRAQLLSAEVVAQCPSEGGTTVCLVLNIRRKHC